MSYRQCCSYEINERLLRKKYKKKIIQQVIEKLKELNYLNDRDFAMDLIERKTSDNKGKRLLQQELFKKGIIGETAEKYIAEYFKEHSIDEDELAWYALEKRMNKYKNIDKHKACQKIRVFLLGRGFSYETVTNILEKFCEDL